MRQSSREEFILEEMQRLGFWPKNDNAPTLPEQLIKKEGELQRELSALLQEKRKFEDKETMLAQMRKKRMEEAKKKREQTKQKREEERIEKAEKWKASKEKEIIYLGEEVSGGLNAKESDAPALDSKGLPTFTEEREFAQAMGITIPQLRFLCYHRSVATTTHYKRFGIKKKSGCMRIISAPMPRLKAAQYWVFHNVLNKLSHHEAAHGFVRERSILTNAKEHLNKEVVVNIDLKDFFPSIHFKRVKGLFHKLGYSEKIATIFSLLCTEPDVEEVELDGKTYFVAKGKRALPQGAPTSPAITNLLCYKLDCRLRGVAKTMGFSYTRYADDITFSGNGEAAAKVQQLLWRLHRIIKDEGFTIHPKKIHVMRIGSRQEVTGIVVNKQPGINRKTLHRFRALLNKIEKEGIAGNRWKGGNVVAEIVGYAEFVSMVKPAQGAKFKAQIKKILQQPNVVEELQKLSIQIINADHTSQAVKDMPSAPDDQDNHKPWWDVL
ncbi:MAG: RNA-directed DNA polymerase [Gammaproteobacteria bacterium]|nr:MAG: RNA-directed DNA polymerase [Gammaproteobacteria bacterium]